MNPPPLYGFTYPDLPIMAGREAIVKALAGSRTLVVQGGTGSGKTTQLPKFLLDAGYGEKGLIGVTQPRRIAALAITDRLRQETGRPGLIGSKIRFHEDVPPGAKVKVMTDGILLQEFRRDPYLRRYSCIVLDEAHERSLNVDILLGIFKRLLPRRPDFRLIVTSATLDAERFAVFLAPGSGSAAAASDGRSVAAGAAPGDEAAKAPPAKAPVVEVEGRQYPVTIEYWDPQDSGGSDDPDEETPSRAIPTVEAASMAIRDLEGRRPDNLLCFLPTEKEINELHRELERDMGNRFQILPLYSRLGPADQKRVFQEGGKPKIILATNIAETSLTIPGIGYVVDTGLARISRYHAQTKIQGLPIERISQASARQRAGRAGRVKPGVCIRLYGEAEFNERPAFTEPEVLRSNLANVVLHLLALGLEVEGFPFPDPPAPAALKGAFRQLHELGAVDAPETSAALTEEGRRLSRIPVDVALGKILLKAGDFDVLAPALILAAGVTVQDPRFLPKEEPDRGKAAGLHRRFEDPRSDFIGLLALWIWIHKEWEGFSLRRLRRLCEDNYLSFNRVREWMDLAEQFGRILKVSADARRLEIKDLDADALHKSILSGFLPFLARKKPEEPSYRLAGDKEAFIHPGSSLAKRKPEWIVAAEVRQTSRTFIYRACEIKPAWVEEIAPEACKRTYGNVAWNPERGFVEAVERVSYKGFAIRQDRRVNYEAVAPEECASLFWREGVIRSDSGVPPAEPFRARNQAVLETLAALERKARVRGLVPDEDALEHWYRERAPEVTSRVRLERFLRGKDGEGNGRLRPNLERPINGLENERRTPKEGGSPAPTRSLAFSVEDWAAPLSALDPAAWLPSTPSAPTPPPASPAPSGASPLHPLERLFPDSLESGGRTYPLRYRFDFGDPGDGITLETDLEGLSRLSLPALFHGIPGWRAWIWDWAMERLPAKLREQARPRQAEIARAWLKAVPPPTAPSEAPLPSPAAALVALLGEALDGTGLSLSFPATWPSYLPLHVLVVSATGRRFLAHLDPSSGDAEWFAAARRVAFGEGAESKPFEVWADWARQNHGAVPPPLSLRGLAFGARLPGLPGLAGAEAPRPASAKGPAPTDLPPGACSLFLDPDEAAFHAHLAALHPAFTALREPDRKTLAAFFAKRLQILLDAWGVPDAFRRETSALRDLAAERRLPALFLAEPGQEAMLRAEKEVPPVRAALPKAGSQVKSLASLGQAVGRGQEGAGWAGAALALQSAWISREAFAAWYAFFAQPPLQARSGIADLVAAVTGLKEWEALLASPFHAAWAADALWERLPGGRPAAKAAVAAAWTLALQGGAPLAGPPGGGRPLPESPAGGAVSAAAGPWAPPGDFQTLVARWESTRNREETLRKSFKAARDRLAGRYAALGQALGGLPQEIRGALETLDKGGPWQGRALAALTVEIHVNRAAGRAGGLAAAGAGPAKPDPAAEQKKDQLMKGLSGRFKKL